MRHIQRVLKAASAAAETGGGNARVGRELPGAVESLSRAAQRLREGTKRNQRKLLGKRGI